MITPFRHLTNVLPQKYERYLPTAFDESMTLLEKVNKTIHILDESIRYLNETSDFMDKTVLSQNGNIQKVRDDFETLKIWLEKEGLELNTSIVLNEWFKSGKLTDIINNDVFSMKANKTDVTEMDTRLTSRLSEISYDFKSFGLKGDGVKSDSDAIQNILDYAVTQKLKTIKLPTARYLLTKPVYVNGDDIEIDFSHSTIIWNGVSGLPQQRDLRSIGVINVHGKIEKYGDNSLKFGTVQTFNEGNKDSPCYLSTDKNTLFNVGDYVRLDIKTGHTAGNTTELYPAHNIMAKIIKMQTSDIYLDFWTPFNFKNRKDGVWTSGKAFDYDGTYTDNLNGAKLYKITPRKNVTIKNFHLHDKQNFVSGDETGNQYVSGVSFLYAHNFKAENITGEHTKYPLIINRWSHIGEVTDIQLDKPDLTGAGCGYAVQNIGSLNVTNRNIKANYARHAVDFSDGGFYYASDVVGIGSIGENVIMHGMCEHSIEFDRCNGGNIGFGSSPDYTSMISDVSIKNSKLNVVMRDDLFLQNLSIDGLEGTVYQLNPWNGTIKNLKGLIYAGSIGTTTIRNGTNANTPKRRLLFENIDVQYRQTLSIRYFEKIIFKNSNIAYTDVDYPFTSSNINLLSVNDITFDDTTLKNMIRITVWGHGFLDNTKNPNEKRIYLNVINSRYVKEDVKKKDLYKIFAPMNIENCKVFINASGNTAYFYKDDVAQGVDSLAFVSIVSTYSYSSNVANFTGAEILLTYHQNKLYSTNKEGVALGVPQLDGSENYILKHSAKGNIVKNATLFDRLDSTDNIKY